MSRKLMFLASFVLLAAFVLPVSLRSASPPQKETGIAIKKPVFAGACKICPWGALAEIVKAAMKPYGYDVQICYNCNNPRFVADAKMGPPIEETRKQYPWIPAVQSEPPPN